MMIDVRLRPHNSDTSLRVIKIQKDIVDKSITLVNTGKVTGVKNIYDLTCDYLADTGVMAKQIISGSVYWLWVVPFTDPPSMKTLVQGLHSHINNIWASKIAGGNPYQHVDKAAEYDHEEDEDGESEEPEEEESSEEDDSVKTGWSDLRNSLDPLGVRSVSFDTHAESLIFFGADGLAVPVPSYKREAFLEHIFDLVDAL